MTAGDADTGYWDAPDGTVWFFFAPWNEWTGWMPGEDGTWQRTVGEFRESYPGAPPWDGWTGTT